MSSATLQIKHQQYHLSSEVRIFYIDASSKSTSKGIILLIHGFPETSHQFRHVIPPLASAGYRIIAPDYRGAGYSSKPASPEGYTKAVLAQDLYKLITEHLGIEDNIHVVGHDIGGMIAHAYAAQYPDHLASVTWGECPLPGTRFYEDSKHTPPLWHFDFHNETDIAVALVRGKEKLYIKHFYDRLGQNPSAFSNDDLEFYTNHYSSAGALEAAFTTYRMFEKDGEDNKRWRQQAGRVKIRCLLLSGEHVFMTQRTEEMAGEFYEEGVYRKGIVEGSGHWLAEENPDAFVREVLNFIEER